MHTHQHHQTPVFWMGDSISETGISDCVQCYKAMNCAEKSFLLAHWSHIIEFPPLLSRYRVCSTQQPNRIFFPKASCIQDRVRAIGDKRKPSLCRVLTVLSQQSKLISGENERQPYPGLSRILLVRMWDLIFPCRISSSPDHLCSKSGWAVIQQVLKPTNVPISNCSGNAFRKRQADNSRRITFLGALVLWGSRSWDSSWTPLGNCILWREPKYSFLLDKGKWLHL